MVVLRPSYAHNPSTTGALPYIQVVLGTCAVGVAQWARMHVRHRNRMFEPGGIEMERNLPAGPCAQSALILVQGHLRCFGLLQTYIFNVSRWYMQRTRHQGSTTRFQA
jgi:hypothetical protein